MLPVVPASKSPPNFKQSSNACAQCNTFRRKYRSCSQVIFLICLFYLACRQIGLNFFFVYNAKVFLMTLFPLSLFSFPPSFFFKTTLNSKHGCLEVIPYYLCGSYCRFHECWSCCFSHLPFSRCNWNRRKAFRHHLEYVIKTTIQQKFNKF